jgi:hypothetical protein
MNCVVETVVRRKAHLEFCWQARERGLSPAYDGEIIGQTYRAG